VLLLVCTSAAFSQKNFGVFGGLNYNYLTDGHYASFLSETSFAIHLGVVYEVKLNEKLSFRPKLMYSQQGDRKKSTIDPYFYVTKLDYKLDYINLPLEFKFGTKVYVIAGPQVGYLINTEKMSGDFGDVNSELDFGVNLGGGINFSKFFIELSLYKGFSKVYEYVNEYDDTKFLTNTLVRISLGYNF
jgi:hypothetical protein